MSNSVIETVETVRLMSAPEQREVLARLWAKQAHRETGEIWQTVRFGKNLRVEVYAEEQKKNIEYLRETLQNGALAWMENEAEGTFEIYGATRTFYITMIIGRGFVGFLS